MAGVKAVRLLVLDPDLGARLSPADLPRAQRELLLVGAELPRGPVAPAELLERAELRGTPAGIVMLEGVVIERIGIGERPCARLAGRGDLLCLGVSDDLPIGATLTMEVLEPAFVAILDDRLLTAVQRWPALAGSLLDRMMRRAQEALLRKAISQLPRVEDRLLSLFRMLAARWGRVRSDGIVVELTLTHDLIGELIGARRPTVSLGLRALADTDELHLIRGEGWFIPGERPLSDRLLTAARQRTSLTAVAAELVLLVGIRGPLAGELSATHPSARWADHPAAALSALAESRHAAVIVVDLATPDLAVRAVALLEQLRAHPGARVIALTSTAAMADPDIALLAAAAHDRLPRGAPPESILAALAEQLSIFRAARGDAEPRHGSASRR